MNHKFCEILYSMRKIYFLFYFLQLSPDRKSDNMAENVKNNELFNGNQGDDVVQLSYQDGPTSTWRTSDMDQTL